MASTAKYQCANPNCGAWFEARTADRARGWARSCSKRCASIVREKAIPDMFGQKKKGPFAKWVDRKLSQAEADEEMHEEAMQDCTSGWDEGGWRD